PGHERWHPAPGFYYLRGGGPMLDMGPYYITDLVQLLGPVASVMGSTARPRSERLVTSQPMNGTLIPVEVATHVAGTLEFENGAVVSVTMSFDVPKHRHAPIEIYGDKGSMLVPDPNRFGGEVQVAKTGGEWETMPLTHGHVDGEFRSIGVADMATAILNDRPHRASGALAFHVLEVMEAFQTSANEGRRVVIESRVERPAMLPAGQDTGQID
ncbi:MAG: Gfo/Idh/MocA family oxidoreductase, partial [Bradyrhizobium sp.]|nr:Gfo/Idh/MocA family oxidoreductase [Bradyrhizobium sp.]